MARSRALGLMCVGLVRVVTTVVLWGAMLVPGRSWVTWLEEGRQAAARSGINVDPDFGLILSVPFWLLILAHYLASPIVRRLELAWARRRRLL